MANETKFTPGPWVIERKSNVWTVMADRHVSKDLGYRWKVAVFAGDPKSGNATESNAHLIAAAPLMYEALEALSCAAGSTRLLGGTEFRQAQSALAKARGEVV